jgi:hypothetical protein
MSGTEELKNLLDQLKGEVGPLPPEPPREPARTRLRESFGPPEAPQRLERLQRVFRPEVRRESGVPVKPPNLAWAENKESMLFGMLASLTAALGGILAGLDYLVLIGGVVFMLFSFMLLLALFGSYLNSRRAGSESASLAERVDALAGKVESLGMRGNLQGGGYSQAGAGRDRELERKVEELRVLVKSLAKAVEGRE